MYVYIYLYIMHKHQGPFCIKALDEREYAYIHVAENECAQVSKYLRKASVGYCYICIYKSLAHCLALSLSHLHVQPNVEIFI